MKKERGTNDCSGGLPSLLFWHRVLARICMHYPSSRQAAEQAKMSTFTDIVFRSNIWKLDACVMFLIVQVLCSQTAHCELADLSVVGNPTSQSSVLYGAGNAVDGNIATFSHTARGDPHPWWLLDLGTQHCLGRITVSLRRICCGKHRFITAVARAGLSSNYAENQPCGLPATQAQSVNGAVSEFLCDAPRMARYVSFDIDPSNPQVTDAVLMLAEVTVNEYTSEECPATKDPSPAMCESSMAKPAAFMRMYMGGLIGNPNPLSTEMASSAPLCAVYCNINARCVSFDFSPGNKQCHLYSLDSPEIDVTPDGDFSVYSL